MKTIKFIAASALLASAGAVFSHEGAAHPDAHAHHGNAAATAPAEQTPFPAQNDHRIAMSASLLGLPGRSESGGFAVTLDAPVCVAKSFPHFWDLWEQVTS